VLINRTNRNGKIAVVPFMKNPTFIKNPSIFHPWDNCSQFKINNKNMKPTLIAPDELILIQMLRYFMSASA